MSLLCGLCLWQTSSWNACWGSLIFAQLHVPLWGYMRCSYFTSFQGDNAHCNADAWEKKKKSAKKISLWSCVIVWATNHKAFSSLMYIFTALLDVSEWFYHPWHGRTWCIMTYIAVGRSVPPAQKLPSDFKFVFSIGKSYETKCIWYIEYITDVSFNCFIQYLNKSEILLLR